jgi:predicted ArsR family transcriptional regulator
MANVPPSNTMTRQQSVDDHGRGLGPTRSRVLALMQDVAEPLAADEIGERMGVHPNTARFHLEALEQAGLVSRTAEDRVRPGRPRALFAAVQGAPGVAQRSYRLLAEILTSFMANRLPEPGESAEEAGIVWGRYLAEPTPPFQKVDAQSAVDALVGQLEIVGFESHAEREHDQLRLEINHCPFLEVAAEHRDVVCAVHLGLMRGLLEQMDAPVRAESLEPLVEPSRCIAHLREMAPAS